MRKNPSPSMSLLASIRKLAHIRTLQFEVFFVSVVTGIGRKKEIFLCVYVLKRLYRHLRVGGFGVVTVPVHKLHLDNV